MTAESPAPADAALNLDAADVDTIDREASVWMHRGMALVDDAAGAAHRHPGASAPASALDDAVACFDRAIDLRRRLPLTTSARFRYGLAAGWLNKGEALTRLGNGARLADALRCYDDALALLRTLPLDADARFRRRIIIAWQNRGLVLQAIGEPARAEARRSFAEALALVDDDRADAIPDRTPLRATVLANLANLLASAGTIDATADARAAAARALALVRETERGDVNAAATGLQARHAQCRAIAARLSASADAVAVEDAAIREHVHEATDAVDDGLAIARAWERQGVDRFRGLAYDLFRFGVRIYRMYQPQFLDEFVVENFDPARSSGAYVGSLEMRAAALETLWLSFRSSR